MHRNEQGRRDRSRRPRTHRSEFPPAIPRRVAPQQSPLPLRRINPYTSSHEVDAIPRRQPVTEFPCLSRGVHSITQSPASYLTTTSISPFAFRVGFSDPLYFSRAFKRQTVSSPQAYRESVRGD